MRFLLGVLSVFLLVGCGAKANGPLSLYFVGSSRFTTGNRSAVGPGDTLATNLYAIAADTARGTNRLARFTAVVSYSPQRAPFAYPTPITLFRDTLKADPDVTFMDSALTHGDFLYTPVFGVRTTSGTERWTYTVTDRTGHSSARSFVLAVRRSDSLVVYNDYTLNLRVPATTAGARRFIDLKSGLALPAYSVVGSVPNADLQKLTDLIVLPDGLRLASPDTIGQLVRLNEARWPSARRQRTRFRLTTLLPTDFTSAQDTTSIRNLFTGAGRAYIRTLAAQQVYAFRIYKTDGTKPVFGLMLVKSVPNGTSTVGLQLEVRTAKQPLR
jgi:hypothetical protein